MKDIRQCIDNLNARMNWEKEILENELNSLAQAASQDRTKPIGYLESIERIVEDAKATLARIHELEEKIDLLKFVLEEG